MTRYRWARPGDVNAFFGLMLDNVAVMVILLSSITSTTAPELQQPGQYRFTPAFVLTYMIPGTALGVLFGDLVYTWMAFRLARRSGRDDITAMPLGLDTPSTFGISLLVLVPALQYARSPDGLHLDHDQAMRFAWHVGMAVLLMSGVFKVVLAPLGNAVRRLFPRAGLLGSLAAIALVLIAFLPLLLDGIAGVPLVGMVALVIIFFTLVAHRALPGQFPGALAAVLVGMALYLLCDALGPKLGMSLVPPLHPGNPEPWHPPPLLAGLAGLGTEWSSVLAFALGKLPVALPFALATVIGGIDCTESAAAAGDEYDTRTILMTEGVAALLAGALGGVIQTTPYIGHPAYKKMGGRAAYTLATALFILAAGYFGWVAIMFEWLPKAAMFPILVFVGMEITAQSFHATPTRHYPAVALAILPALGYLCLFGVKSALGPNPPDPNSLVVVQTMRCLANGFLVTGMLWAACLVMILDGKLLGAAGYLFVAALCAFFGIIHSPLGDEQIGLPATILAKVNETPFASAVAVQTPYHWAGAYVLCAVVLLLLAWLAPREEQPAGEKHA
jgi:AGZA family xanthine/uracil permease-like MFS transporter